MPSCLGQWSAYPDRQPRENSGKSSVTGGQGQQLILTANHDTNANNNTNS